MLIDWFTVGAQTLNFIILIWLMKRFLYQPILNAIDAREKIIADELARADRISQEANQTKASFERKNSEFEQQRDELMLKATDAAHSERQRLLENAHQAAAKYKSNQHQAIENQTRELQDSIRTAAQKALFSMARNALRDLATADIEAQMVAVFANRLHSLDDEQKRTLMAALEATQINVLSSNTLLPDQQDTISSTLEALLGRDIQPQFHQSDDLIGGIELEANGFKIGWSVAEYLRSLEESLFELTSTHINSPRIDVQTPTSSNA